ncbi:MAG: hypothetical protein KAI28_03685 [Sphingomonadales bacterium]|nr:hypothetical protein [Sphingomonadales bacterium]
MAYDPFSESTRKTKRNLLAVSFVGLLHEFGYIKIAEKQAFFVSVKAEPNMITWALVAVTAYLLVSAIVHVLDDWRNPLPPEGFNADLAAKKTRNTRKVEETLQAIVVEFSQKINGKYDFLWWKNGPTQQFFDSVVDYGKHLQNDCNRKSVNQGFERAIKDISYPKRTHIDENVYSETDFPVLEKVCEFALTGFPLIATEAIAPLEKKGLGLNKVQYWSLLTPRFIVEVHLPIGLGVVSILFQLL